MTVTSRYNIVLLAPVRASLWKQPQTQIGTPSHTKSRVMHKKSWKGKDTRLTFTVSGRGRCGSPRALVRWTADALGLVGLVLVGSLRAFVTYVAVDLLSRWAIH